MKRRTLTRSRACATVAKSLRDFGYPDVTAEMIDECLTAFLAGKRDLELPHGVIGAFASRQFQEIEDTAPGALARLEP